jgi:hypothetical protein
MTNRILRYSGLGLAVLTAGAMVACGSDDPGTPGGTAGKASGGASSGGAGGSIGSTAGTTATAGSATAGSGTAGSATAGSGGTGGAGFACANTLPTAALITDFSNLVPATSGNNFTFAGGVLGGTFSYQPNALTLDTVTNTVLNVKGNIKAYDGFGLYFNTCYDASAYTGISFSVKGNAGPTGKLNFRVQTNSNTAIDATNKKGTCVASNPADTYPDCHASAFDIPVTATATTITVMWAQLAGGVPTAAVTGKDIVGLEWAFNWTPGAVGGTAGSGAGGGASAGAGGASAGAGGASGGAGGKASGGAGGGTAGGASGGAGGAAAGPYDADVTIDDVKFLGGPAGGSGGAGGGSSTAGAGGASGGASGGSGGASAGSGGASAGNGGKAGSN